MTAAATALAAAATLSLACGLDLQPDVVTRPPQPTATATPTPTPPPTPTLAPDPAFGLEPDPVSIYWCDDQIITLPNTGDSKELADAGILNRCEYLGQQTTPPRTTQNNADRQFRGTRPPEK